MTRARQYCFIFLTLWLAADATAHASHAVIFMYHQFGRDDVPQTNIPLDAFEKQLAFLAAENFEVLPLSEMIERLRTGKPLGDRTVAITIDDAYRSVYEKAFPLLRKRRWPFTVFVATDAVDAGSPALMSWNQMREMAKYGAEFANHSASHSYLIRREAAESAAAWRERVEVDIRKAQQRIQAEIGSNLALFAYPYGEYSAELAQLLEELGYVAFGQHSGAIAEHSDFRALPRYPINTSYASLEDFRVKALSLPLPVVRADPFDPVISSGDHAVLEVELAGEFRQWSSLKCYVSDKGVQEVEWLSQSPPVFRIKAKQALPSGRSRYNCTALSHMPGRYYWFSHLWVRL